jgi:dipeptidyl aminopeptidase/acylaminoacyl peptidase
MPSNPSVYRRASFAALLFTATILCATNVPAQQPAFNAADILSAPFVPEMSASPAGGRVAWVANQEGKRNIFVATAPEFRARQLTATTRDDGQDVTSLTWTPDGRTLFYVRGAAANRAGENPNPASNPGGAEQAIWRVSVDGGAPVRISEGSGPIVSPRGDALVFQRGGALWKLRLGGAANATPERLFSARGSSGSARFSPDGTRIAFVSGRGTHSFIGVYDLDKSTLKWIAPSVDTDIEPAWSPDGMRLAFIRQPTARRPLMFRAVREAEPWSIMVADAATGAVRRIWTADNGSGSAFWGVTATNQLIWTADDRIVFPWEKTGWLSLWSVAASGGNALQLTPGTFEVEFVRLARDGRTILFNSNQGDIERRHLWRVAASGGPPVAVTRGEGIEWSPQELSDNGGIVALRSTARRPSHPVIIASGEARELHQEIRPARFPENALVVPQAVSLTATDGMQVPAQLFLPRDLRAGERRPAVIFFHGGSRRQMLLGWHYMGYYHDTYAMNQWLANAGYVVLSVNYRSGTGYGRDFREALNYGSGGASEFADVLGAGLYMRGRADVDPTRVGLWGGSYGGFLTAMGLSRASDLFAAGVDIHGVHDWNVGIRTFVPNYNTLEQPDSAAVAFRSSPMSSIDGWRSPVLVIHGDDDRNVSFIETVTLVDALRKRGVHVEQLVFPDEVHSFLLYANRVAALQAAGEFFERKLKGSGR